MRFQHIENAVKELFQTKDFAGLPQLFERPAELLRWNLWHGKVMTAATHLKVLIIDCDRFRPAIKEQRTAGARVIARCQELHTCLSNSFDTLMNMALDIEKVSQFRRPARKGVSMTSATPVGAKNVA